MPFLGGGGGDQGTKIFQVAVVYTVVVDMYGLLGESYSVLGGQLESVRINLDKREICRKTIFEHTRETRNMIKTCQNFGIARSTLYRS